tara:strand:- start:4793 stop:6085 length:1293 start_codon:yes stop_codon:yes gene_type:complete
MNPQNPKVVFVTAGGAGMYCGSCMRDNTQVRNLIQKGWDIELVPAYTPVTTDEEDVSIDRVVLGGINMFLDQAVPLFQYLPGWVTNWLDRPGIIRRATSGTVKVDAAKLGPMTLATVKGEAGAQRREHRKFVRWLKEESQPNLINLTNLLIGGCIPMIRKELPNVPILVTIQGDDLFLDQLTEPWRSRVIEQMRSLAQDVDGFVTFSRFYADVMSRMLEIEPDKFHIVPLGIEAADFHQLERLPGRPATIGFFARISPEKGFHHFVDGFLELAKRPGMEDVHIRAGGWLAGQDEEFYAEQLEKLKAAGLDSRFTYVGSPDRAGKLRFFQEIDLFSVPTEYLEPKGLYVLEALASGLPVVQPHHGSFPELLEGVTAARLVEPKNPIPLADAWLEVLETHSLVPDRHSVAATHSAEQMADAAAEIYRQYLNA